MNLKNRTARIEDALHARGGVRLEWIEPDENGNYPPPSPGAKVIEIKWIEDPAPAQG